MAGASVVATGRWNGGNLRRGAQQDLNYLQRQANGFSKSVVASFGGIGAAMGGIFAAGAVVDFFKQSAQAAMEDEKSMVALSKAMDNVGLSSQNAQAEGLIESMMLQVGIADDQLRPAFQKLVTVTQDVTKAQDLLQTALDLSAAGYGDLTAVTKALSAAANGNFTALKRLKIPIDEAAMAAKDFDGIIASLNETVGGQAVAASQTYAGQLARLSVAAGEAQEAVGYALLRAVDDLSNALGGTGGLQNVILEAGDRTAAWIDDVRNLVKSLADATTGTIKFMSLGLIPMNKDVDVVRISIDTMGQSLLRIGGPLAVILDGLRRLGLFGGDASDATKAVASATVLAGIAAGKAAPLIGDLGDETEAAAMKAWDGSQSYLSFAESIVLAEMAARDFGNTSSTVQAAILEGARLGGVPGYWDRIREKYGETETAARGAASGTDRLTESQKRAQVEAEKLKENTNSLAESLRGMLEEISPAVVDMTNVTFDAINKQIEKFKATFAEAKQYAQGIVDGFMGQLDIGKALEDAKATGTTLVEAFVKQGDKVVEFGGKMNALLKQGLSKAAFDDIMKLGYERGTEVANALSDGNVAGNIASVNKVYESVKTMAEQVAEAAADAFYQAGLEVTYNLIRAMVEALGIGGKGRRRLMNLMDELAASMNRTATIYVGVSGPGAAVALPPGIGDYTGVIPPGYDFPLFPPGTDIPLDFSGGIAPPGFMFADGGIATSPTPGIFGEAGPEALIPLDRMGDFGGNTYQITVQAGVGDPRAIGKSVVEAITLFERSSGPVFARA